MCYGAVVDGFRAAITYKRSLIKTFTSFPDIIRAGLISGKRKGESGKWKGESGKEKVGKSEE